MLRRSLRDNVKDKTGGGTDIISKRKNERGKETEKLAGHLGRYREALASCIRFGERISHPISRRGWKHFPHTFHPDGYSIYLCRALSDSYVYKKPNKSPMSPSRWSSCMPHLCPLVFQKDVKHLRDFNGTFFKDIEECQLGLLPVEAHAVSVFR